MSLETEKHKNITNTACLADRKRCMTWMS